MTYKLLSFNLAAMLFLAATVSAIAGSLSAGQTSTTSGSSGQASSSSPNQMTPAPSNAPQVSQPAAATGDTKPLTSVQNAEHKLASANVQDMLGRPIGRVQSVRTDTSGTPTSVKVALNTQTEAGKIVQLPASQLRYDTHSGAVVAQLTQTEIDAIPATSPQSGATNESDATAPASANSKGAAPPGC
jgi:hypothetical protein